MHFSILATLPLLVAGFGERTFQERIDYFEKLRNAQPNGPDRDFDIDAAPKFLNAKTKPYSVDGKNIPEVNFNAGESYAGHLPIGDGSNRKLFFWFFPTVSPNNTDVTVWLNGGPGCSSFVGFLEENGPISWRPGTKEPVRNPWSWHKLTNMVWIEQPVATGFATGKPNITNEVELAQQFNGFWKNFLDLFGLHNRKVYLTGESYAGMYVPYIGASMLKEKDKKYFDLNGALIYDPLIGHDYQEATTIPWAKHNAALVQLTQDSQEQVDAVDKKCGLTDYVNSLLTFPPPQKKGLVKKHYGRGLHCAEASNIIYDTILTLNPCFNVYYLAQQCPYPYDPLVDGNPYFNRKDVKEALHAPSSVEWQECAYRDVFKNYDKSRLSALGKNSAIAQVVEGTKNMIVGHGTLDALLLSNDTLISLNNMTFNGARGFTEPVNKPFYIPNARRYKNPIARTPTIGYWTSARGLTFVEINLSGHMVPQFQPKAAYRNLQVLLGIVDNHSSKIPVES